MITIICVALAAFIVGFSLVLACALPLIDVFVGVAIIAACIWVIKLIIGLFRK